MPVLTKTCDLDLEDDLSGSLFLLFRQNLIYMFSVFLKCSLLRLLV